MEDILNFLENFYFEFHSKLSKKHTSVPKHIIICTNNFETKQIETRCLPIMIVKFVKY